MDFDENIELASEGFFIKRLQPGLLQRCDDEQDGIRSGDAGFPDLGFVNGEVLAQKWEFHRTADLCEVAEVALEELLVGEDGDAMRTGVFVSLRDGDGIEIG